MKKLIKLCSILLCVTIMLGALPACRKEESKIDKTKTQLYVAVYDGGYEKLMAEESIKRFEAKYADYSFEEGKKGVQIVHDLNTSYIGNQLVGQTKNFGNDVYIVPKTFYYDMYDNGNGDMLDITSAFTTNFQYDFIRKTTDTTEEDGTIVEKADKATLDFLNVGTETEPKYYAYPYNTAKLGLWYDVNMFNENNWYFVSNTSNIFVSEQRPNKSAGPDGQTGTYDDGLPATYEQFFELCKKIRASGVSPVGSYALGNSEYSTSFLSSLYSDYEGKDNIAAAYNFDGSAMDTIVTGFNDNGPITTTLEITPENAWKAHAYPAGKYYALKFGYDLATGSYGGKKFLMEESSGYSAWNMQRAFVANKFDKNTDVAMINDGDYWYNEAKNDIATVKKQYKLTDEEINYAWLPLPKATPDKIGQPETLLFGQQGMSLLFVSSNIASNKKDLALEFVQFLLTDQTHREYIEQYSMMLNVALEVDYESEWFLGQNNFVKNLIKSNEKMQRVYAMSNNETYRKVASGLGLSKGFLSRDPIGVFVSTGNTETARSMFDSLTGYTNLFENI